MGDPILSLVLAGLPHAIAYPADESDRTHTAGNEGHVVVDMTAAATAAFAIQRRDDTTTAATIKILNGEVHANIPLPPSPLLPPAPGRRSTPPWARSRRRR